LPHNINYFGLIVSVVIMVTVIDGQLTRTWNYIRGGVVHVISVYHDPLTGVRSAMLNHEEIPGSLGNSSMFMENSGHRILFSIRGVSGYIEIKKVGWFGFDYECIVGGEKLVELTQKISQSQGEEVYDIKIAEHRSGSDGYSEDMITWYLIETTRLADGYTNTVHRRFKDFVNLNSDIRQHFKGHHLLSSLPSLPERKSKMMTDHNDPAFLTERETQLQTYLTSLIRVPHVSDLTSTKAFLGLMEKVRETSLVFTTQTIGITLIPCDSPGTPAVIGFIQNPDSCMGLLAGDIVSKINGNATGSLTFNGVVRMLKHLPRPIVVHFVQALACPESDRSFRDKDAKQTPWKGDVLSSSETATFDDEADEARPVEHLPSFSADNSDTVGFVESSTPVQKQPAAVTGDQSSTYTSFRDTPSPRPNTSPSGGENEYVSFS